MSSSTPHLSRFHMPAAANRGSSNYPEPIRRAMMNPYEALQALDVYDAEDSLLSYTRMMWRELEPKRELVTGWALDAIVDHLEAVEAGHIKRLLINVPPGFMKSMQTSVFFPSWCWGPRNRPDLRFICASYSQALTLRDNRRCRQLIASSRYQESWGDRYQISSDQDTKSKFENDRRGWKLATSVRGLGTGERGDVFIIDDPHNVKDGDSDKVRESTLQWFTEVVPTRVNDADDSVLLVIMQRVHQKDVSGLIISKELGYDHLCIPMNFERESEIRSRTYLNFVDPREDEGQLAWPERFSADAVKTLKKTLSATGGDYAVSGQLQQRPTPRGGGKFKKSWWRFFRTEANDTFGDVAPRPAGCWDGPAVPLPSDFDTAFVSSDCGFRDNTNNSRVSHLVLGFDGPYCFVLDNVTEHQDFLQTVECIATVDPVTENLTGGLLHKWKDIVDGALVEGKANGDAVVNTLSRNIAGIITIDPEGGKQSRANAIVLPVRSGHVLLPDGAPWLDDFVDELANFPVGTHDDQVDALSQGIIYTIENQDELTALWMSKL